MFALRALLVLTAFVGSWAAPSPSGVLINGPDVIPSAFGLLGAAADVTPFEMTFHLTGRNLAGLASLLETNAASLADPLSEDKVASYATPSDADLNAVQAYLTSQGYKTSDMTFSAFKDTITVPTTVGKAASMLATSFSSYSINGATVPRAKAYTIPSAISKAVTLISPIASFVNVRTGPIKKSVTPGKKRALMQDLESRAVPAGCSTTGVTPTCLRNLYQTASYTPVAGSTTDVFIAGFIGQSFSQSDLTNFLRNYRPDAASYRIPVINRAGAINLPLTPGVEAMLDTETVASQIYPLKSTFFNYGTQATQGDVFALAMRDIINNYQKYGRPGVYSISYGADESSVTQAEATSMCNTAMQLTALGTTIVLSSGDNGVGGQQGDTCPPFVPTYPSGCQYILSVGATQNFSPEVAVDPSLAGFYSGAGFSNLFPVASYQAAAVSAYKGSIGTLDAGSYNAGGRAYPDVSAQGSLYIIISMGLRETVSGTSASAPTTASVIALLNNARKRRGRGNIGWFNPFAYNSTSAFTDVTSGSSNGCGSSNLGFPTKAGWDPSTGVGTPLFTNLRTAVGG